MKVNDGLYWSSYLIARLCFKHVSEILRTMWYCSQDVLKKKKTCRN